MAERSTRGRENVTLLDVRSAIAQGDRVEAVALLKVVLERQPSAEAWLLAATLTRDPSAAIAHLRRGLLLDPKHPGCRAMLKRLGGASSSSTGFLGTEIVAYIQDQCARSVLLRGLPPQLQLGAFGLIVLLIAGAIFTSVSLLRPERVSVAADMAPAAAAVPLISLDRVTQHVAASSVPVTRMETVHYAASQQKHSVRLDMSGIVAEIVVYDSLSALIGDRASFDSYPASTEIVGLSNTVLVYPAALPEEKARQLLDTFLSLNGS